MLDEIIDMALDVIFMIQITCISILGALLLGGIP